MSNTQIKKWSRWFKNSRSDTLAILENVEHVEVVINENCRLTTLENDIAIPKIIVYFWNFNSRFESRDCKIFSAITNAKIQRLSKCWVNLEFIILK